MISRQYKPFSFFVQKLEARILRVLVSIFRVGTMAGTIGLSNLHGNFIEG